jgi:pyruvate-formate lyase-activating enzyme
MAYSDHDGNVYDYPGLEPAFRTGKRFVGLDAGDLIKLPFGSYLFSLPGRLPVYREAEGGGFRSIDRRQGVPMLAASAFLASGYLRTHLPAFVKTAGAPVLPMWAYAGVAISGNDFLVPAIRIDEDPRSDPAIHRNDEELAQAVSTALIKFPGNRLVAQLSRCSTDYRCLCARNFFLQRHEAPVPSSPSCNSSCVGCLSRQENGAPFPASQPRLDFLPTPEEISEVIVSHFQAVDAAVASFGQGCEGEPLLRGNNLAAAVRMVRERTGRGTININTNGSLPEMVSLLIDSGIDSIRISLNSPSRQYYEKYYRPSGYGFDDVRRSVGIAIERGVFVSLNLFFLPGFTDMETEALSLMRFLDDFPVNMVQARNLNIDPDYYLEFIGFEESDPLGIPVLLDMIREKRPGIILGYYNPPRERFGAVQN